VTYPHNHPFSPHYRGRIAQEYCNPRYPNRVQPPAPETKQKLCAGETPAGKVLRRIMDMK
jgi:hypothetical protein